MLAEGPYVSIISRHQIGPEMEQGHMVPLPIPLDRHKRSIGLTYRTTWRPTATQARFLDLLRANCPADTGPGDGENLHVQ
jgi:DNA-binding transcriptional LysR family regulator